MKQDLSSGSPRILLVDDSDDDFESTVRAFRKVNFNNPIVRVSSGEEALDYLNGKGRYAPGADRPTLILLDLNMPGLGGRRTLQKIKEVPELRGIPIVVLTTSNDSRDVEDCYQEGANTYIQKPVDFNGLIQAIQGLKEYWFEIAVLPKAEI